MTLAVDGTFRVRDTTYPASRRMRRHIDGVTRLSIVLAGTLRETAARSEVVAQAGAIVLKDGDAEHATDIGDSGSRVLSIELPDDTCAGTAHRYRWRQDPSALRAGYALWHAVRSGDRRPAQDRLYDCLALMTDADERPAAPGWLLDVKTRLEDEGDETIGTAVIAAQLGCHPVYLARAFRRAFGCSISEFRQWQRVRRVLDGCHGGRDHVRLSDVAQQAGYFDQSHMWREVRRWTGLAPTAWSISTAP